jgi:predicted RNA methylase
VNKVLAEYYGPVVGDAFSDKDEANDLFSKTGAVSKDLQFYPSPDHVVEEMVDRLAFKDRNGGGYLVLEPSAGQGALAIAAAQRGARVHAIEFVQRHIDVMNGLANGAGVGGQITAQRANFLKVKPQPIYDLVLMNPPLSGMHWMQHVRHAFEFLAPGGILRSVLPASAAVNETAKHTTFRKWAKSYNNRGWAGPFQDLPAESFKSSGTLINTVTLELRKPD